MERAVKWRRSISIISVYSQGQTRCLSHGKHSVNGLWVEKKNSRHRSDSNSLMSLIKLRELSQHFKQSDCKIYKGMQRA